MTMKWLCIMLLLMMGASGLSAQSDSGHAAALRVEKLAGTGGAWHTADYPPGFSVPASREVRFRIVVANDGVYPFTNIAIADTMLTLTDCEIPSELAAGDSFQCSTKRIEVGSGVQVNTVTVSAVANGETYSVSDPAHFVAAAELKGDVVTVNGTVTSIESNVIVVADRTIVLRPGDPVLAVLEIGDQVRIEGTDDDDRILMALIALIADADVYVGNEPGEIYRDDARCIDPPPLWAPVYDWHRKCQLTSVKSGALSSSLHDRRR